MGIIHQGQAFRRAKSMFAAVTAAMALAGFAREMALQAIGPYVSHGKGRHRSQPGRNFFRPSHNGPMPQGERECARRVRQMNKGMIR